MFAVNPLAPLGLGFGGAVAAGQVDKWELTPGMAWAASPAGGVASSWLTPKVSRVWTSCMSATCAQAGQVGRMYKAQAPLAFSIVSPPEKGQQ